MPRTQIVGVAYDNIEMTLNKGEVYCRIDPNEGGLQQRMNGCCGKKPCRYRNAIASGRSLVVRGNSPELCAIEAARLVMPDDQSDQSITVATSSASGQQSFLVKREYSCRPLMG